MKRLALLIGLLLLPQSAMAGVTCALPFNLQNGTTADATQVMANYNALVSCLGNAAAAGANNDITALSALVTPITPTQGGTNVYTGGTSTGSANVQAVTPTVPTTFSLTAGKIVTFFAGFTNTGAMTLNVAGSGNVNVFRRTQLGISATVGGEIVAGQTVTVIHDGTQFQLLSVPPVTVGQISDFAGSTAPAGYQLLDASCQLRVGVFADLFTVIGTTYDPTGSTCDVNHFFIPDGRGRTLYGKDNMGGSAANRITGAVTCNGLVLGTGCGSQSSTLTSVNQLPSYTPTGTVSVTSAIRTQTATGLLSAGGTHFAVPTSESTNFDNTVSSIVASGATQTFTGDAVGISAPIATLSPGTIVNKIIKY